MKVSLNWLKQFGQVDLTIDQLVSKIGSQLGAVESVTNLGQRYQGIIVAKVVSVANHPNADKLHVCQIDDGHKVADIDRNAQGFIQVVCGAPNVKEGMSVAWLPPGVIVPESYDKEPYALEVRDIRGQKSNGMLASAKELALGDDHNGILEVDLEAKAGDDFAVLYELDDQIIELENKMFTHRPDCFGQLGIAREVAGITNKQFESPEWYTEPAQFETKGSSKLSLSINNELPELVPRYMAVVMDEANIKPLPILLQSYLLRLGIRPINNVVDITNYMMLLSGQPIHAYDYDKVKNLASSDSPDLVIRYPKPSEKLTILGGKVVELNAESIVIATDQQPIGLAGVMGGADTEVDQQTKRLIIECANFDMYAIRRSSMVYGLFTDAATRFSKGQSPLQCDRVLSRTILMIEEYVGAKLASSVLDDSQVGGRAWVHPPVPVAGQFINGRLGFQLSDADIKKLLENVEFKVAEDNGQLNVIAPFWRTDIEIRQDVSEEVGRLFGYDKLPIALPNRSLLPVSKNEFLVLKNKIRSILSHAGANEVLSYSFVDGDLLTRVGQDKNLAWRLANALRPELQYYRLSLTPSLLEKIYPNLKNGYSRMAIFELGKAHQTNLFDLNEPAVPAEFNSISLVVTAKADAQSSAYYLAKVYLLDLIKKLELKLTVNFEPLASIELAEDDRTKQLVAPFEPNRSAILRHEDGHILGVIGEFKLPVQRSLKLPRFCAGWELDIGLLSQLGSSTGYIPLSRFPRVDQDICLRVPIQVQYQQIFDVVEQHLLKIKPGQTVFSLSPVDIYQSSSDDSHKQATLRLSIVSYQRTMTDREVNNLLDQVAEIAKTELQAERL